LLPDEEKDEFLQVPKFENDMLASLETITLEEPVFNMLIEATNRFKKNSLRRLFGNCFRYFSKKFRRLPFDKEKYGGAMRK
jgi:hypothetical protein